MKSLYFRALGGMALLALPACTVAPGALPDPALGWSVQEIAVDVAADAPLSWCETRYGCDNVEARVKRVVSLGLTQAAAGVDGPVPVRLEAEVTRFRGLTMAEAYTGGGQYDVAITLRARDAAGRELAGPTYLHLDHYGLGGLMLLIAEGGQRERLSAEIARDARAWMAERGRRAAAAPALPGPGVASVRRPPEVPVPPE